MALSSGVRFGPYEILTLIGKGGMGEVYRARDTKLDREVAIKVLPEEFARDRKRLDRFEREARLLAQLNHANIATLHGLEQHDGQPFLVMELVEGETLADRIANGPVPIDEAIPLFVQIAEGLEAAHEKGIIHRDLKPANIKVRPEGKPKILDFGLAKAFVDDEASAADSSQSPTLTKGTELGVILGTPAYMSPEQARGKKIDKRTDIWAFGCCLYEALTGKAPFRGETVSDTLGKILEREADWAALPVTTPALVRSVLRRCLHKDPRRRIHDIADAKIELEAGPEEPSALAQPVSEGWRRGAVRWAATILLAIAAGSVVGYVTSSPEPGPRHPRTVRFGVLPPEGAIFEASDEFKGLALSPDGRHLVFAAMEGAVRQLFLRALDSPEASPLPGTEHASYPFWSPDSRFVGFFASGKLKKINIAGGPSQTLCDAAQDRGGTWNRDGVILFAPDYNGPLYRVSAAGGSAAPFTTLDASRQEHMHRWPQFLPDGKHFLYVARSSNPQHTGIYVRSLDTEESRQLVVGTYSNAAYSPPHLLFVQGDTLMAQTFDASRLELSGEPLPAVENVGSLLGNAHFSVSQTGVLAFRAPDLGRTLPIWFDREGKQNRALGLPGIDSDLSLSPDERWLASTRVGQQPEGPDLWLFDLSHGTTSRLTFHPAHDHFPIWSPDGSRIVFSSTRLGGGGNDLFLKPSSGAEEVELLLRTGATNIATDWSADGRFILYQASVPETTFDIWALPLEGERKPIPLVRTAFSETAARLSPDGRWLAYTSDESGKHEVYVRPFLEPGGSQPVSTSGGLQPLWRRDGEELFYLTLDQKVMSVRVESGGSSIRLSAPRPLFEAPILLGEPYKRSYAVSRDGQSFLIATGLQRASSPIQVVVNWMPENKD